MAPVAGRSVCGTMASRRERALCRPVFPRFQLAYTCARTRVSRSVTRKRIYAPNRLPLYNPRSRGELIWAAASIPGRGATVHYSTFRSEMLRRTNEREEGRKGEESSTKRTEFTVRDGEVERKGWQVAGMLWERSHRRRRSPVTIVNDDVPFGGGIHLPPAIGVIYSRDNPDAVGKELFEFWEYDTCSYFPSGELPPGHSMLINELREGCGKSGENVLVVSESSNVSGNIYEMPLSFHLWLVLT